MTTERDDRILAKRLAADEAREGEVLALAVRIVVLVPSVSGGLFGEEGAGGGVGGEEVVVELPAV